MGVLTLAVGSDRTDRSLADRFGSRRVREVRSLRIAVVGAVARRIGSVMGTAGDPGHSHPAVALANRTKEQATRTKEHRRTGCLAGTAGRTAGYARRTDRRGSTL